MRVKLLSLLIPTIVIIALLIGHPKWLINAAEKGSAAPKPSPQNDISVKIAAEVNKLPPNELGRIMILEYHLIGYPEAEWRRTPENFIKDLTMLYEKDYYPIALADLVHGNIAIPNGKTPFILTFDDSSEGQFRFIKKGDQLVVDTLSAVGIMEQFTKEHPDFPLTATFFVLPAIKPKLRLFGQEEYIQQKFAYLQQHGYEIGNHSFWHQNLGKSDDEGVQKQLALAVRAVQSYLPGYQVRSLALPLGVHAKNQALEHEGEYQGIKYRHDSILLVGSGSAPSPYSVEFDPYKLERIQAGDTVWGPKAYVERYRKNPAFRYVSDGDSKKISFPKTLETKINKKFLNKYKLQMLEIPALNSPNPGMKSKTLNPVSR